jgi:predicted Rossmann fold flavoprotein
MRKNEGNLWDVAVVGGGASGMMAAGRAAERGLKVVLIEKNDSLGKKLLITGGGRCNVTNAELDMRKFLSKFKKNDKFLFSAFTQYGVPETLEFFHGRGMPTKIEAERRAFPVSEQASSVWHVLVSYMKQGGVTVLPRSPALGFKERDGMIDAVRMKNGGEIRARSFILATGGKSRPETGSTGEGFEWLAKLGHRVIEPDAALVPVKIKDAWVKRLQGVSLPEAKITIFQHGAKQDMKKGKLLFTHFGLSGPGILNASRDIGELLKYGQVVLSLDLFPSLDHGALDRQIKDIIAGNSNKKFKNILGGLFPAAFAPVLIELAGIDPDVACHSLAREDRMKFGRTAKDMRMTVAGLLGVDKAIVTSGGVALEQVDFRTMASRLFPNLYLIGDVLNIDRPSGGYSLQLCWTTGYVAGSSVPGKE